MKYHDIEQNSDEWYQMRAGKLTSSNLAKVMANYGKAFGEPAKKYAVTIAVEQITGKPISSDYQNEHMQRGHEQEPIARELYEQETFSTVYNGGFFCSDSIGCSQPRRRFLQSSSVRQSVRIDGWQKQALRAALP